MGVDQRDEIQLLGQGIEEGGGPKLSAPHGLECRALGLGGGRGALRTKLLHDPLLGTQVNLLDDTGVAIDPGGADPVEIGFTFFPLGDQARHNVRRVIPYKKYVNNCLENR